MKKFLVLTIIVFAGIGVFAQANSKAKVIQLNDSSFKEKVFDYANSRDWNFKGNKPAIVDFYATWCGPCKRIAPVLKKLQKEYGNEIQIYKVDTDKSPELSTAFGIRSIPSLLFIPMKGKPTMAQGALPEEKLVKAIKDILGVDPPKLQQ